ncbi:Heat shock protein 70kD [Gracilaria domingensis]|nr:Heat shock protein 70kD [Gracilaria domingensis]
MGAAPTDRTSAPALSPLPTLEDAQQSHQLIPSVTLEQLEQPLPASPSIPLLSVDEPLKGFDTLDDVQRFSLGALAVVLLNERANDLNDIAFARTQSTNILQALNLSPSQQTALIALEPSSPSRNDVITDCVNLVGDEDSRFRSLQAMLAISVAAGTYDARSRAFLTSVAVHFRIPWPVVAAVELAVAIHLLEQAQAASSGAPAESLPQLPLRGSTASDDSLSTTSSSASRPNAKSVDQLLTERRKKKIRVKKAMKIGGITLAGGVMFGLTGGLIAPALLTALAGVGVAGAAGLAASGSVASAAVVGGLFGVAGAGFSVKKAKNRVSTTLEEFDFEHPDDPRVIEERKRRVQREKRRWEKEVAERLKAEAAKAHMAIEDDPGAESQKKKGEIDAEKELPRPPTQSDDEEDEYDDLETGSKKSSHFGKRKKKREKRKVGSRGLESRSQVASLHVCICVPAWLTDRGFGSALDQFEPALKVELPCSQHIVLRWESRRLFEMAMAFAKFWASKATVTTLQQTYPHAVAAASTMAGAVAFAIAMPLTVMSCMDYVDNPWSILVSRSNGAGEELADVLVERSYGNRPVTLFAYSIGARVVLKCLESLASRRAHGIVDNVFIMGGAVTADPERWKKFLPVIAGRIVNAYGSDDWALAFFHRGCGHGMYVAGLRKMELERVENLNMAYLGFEGHRELKDCIPRVMRAMGVGTGYITMPPAKLVKKRSRSKRRSHSLVCEEPGKLHHTSNGNHSPTGTDSDSESKNSVTSSLQKGAQSDDNGVLLPPPIAHNTADDNTPLSNYDKLRAYRSNSDAAIGTKSKSRSKSWLSWGSWPGVGFQKKSKGRPKNPSSSVNDKQTGHFTDEFKIADDVQTVSIVVPSAEEEDEIPIVGPDTLDGPYPEDRNTSSVNVAYTVESVDEVRLENADLDDDEVEETFDWEKQRRIWDEQERQIEERGYADSAIEIEAQGKVILGLSIEIAGRRLHPFVEQDVELPVSKKEEVFTNCLEDQSGVVVRLYEHERRTKTVPLNMLRYTERYPKLLGELEVMFRGKARRGDLRIAVSVSVDEDGDVNLSVEERFDDNNVGEQAELSVSRSDLCTMGERLRLEAAERSRAEARREKEKLKSDLESVKALPAAEESKTYSHDNQTGPVSNEALNVNRAEEGQNAAEESDVTRP